MSWQPLYADMEAIFPQQLLRQQHHTSFRMGQLSVHLCFYLQNDLDNVYRQQLPHRALINHDKRQKIDDAPLTLTFMMGQGACHFVLFLHRDPIVHSWMSATYCFTDYPGWKTKIHWYSIDGQCKNGTGWMSLFAFNLKVANTCKKDNDLQKSVLCHYQ